jgi:hypothetical protein
MPGGILMSLHRFVISSLLVFAAAAVWAPLGAQSAPQDTAATTAPVVFARPIPSIPPLRLVNVAPMNRGMSVTPALAASDARQLAATAEALPAAGRSTSTAMMIVGGAGMLVGAVVGGKGGTVIMIGGGLVGLLGLWNYLK